MALPVPSYRTKAIFVPCGDHLGRESELVDVRVTSLEPSAFMTTMLPWRSAAIFPLDPPKDPPAEDPKNINAAAPERAIVAPRALRRMANPFPDCLAMSPTLVRTLLLPLKALHLAVDLVFVEFVSSEHVPRIHDDTDPPPHDWEHRPEETVKIGQGPDHHQERV